MKKYIYLIPTFIFLSFFAYSNKQIKNQNKEEAMLSSQSWTVYNVKSRRPYTELGEVFNFRLDKSFYYDQNNYAKRGGTWTLTNKKLILVWDSFTEERRKIPMEYKVKKLKNGIFKIKYRNRNNKKETIYLN